MILLLENTLILKKLKLNKNLQLHILVFIVFILCCAHLSLGAFARTNINTPSYKTITGLPTIIDGDSIRVNGLEMRLLGIDAPELFQICGNKQNKYFCGKLAKNHLLELVGGRPITCNYRKFDKYNRALAFCFLGDRLLNLQMIKDGWAVSYYNFRKEERSARKAKLGIWHSEFQKPKDWRKKHHHANGRALANSHINM